MKIGIVSDIHGNYLALNEMLEKEYSVKTWMCLGDIVGLLPKVNETIELIRKKKLLVILGDHDIALLNGSILPQSSTATKILNIQNQIITSQNRAYLYTLPESKHITFDSTTFYLTHSLGGTLEKRSYSLDIKEIEKKNTVDVILYGHTHLPLLWYGTKIIIINPGSLGFPITKMKKNTYAIYDTVSHHTEFRYVTVNKRDIVRECLNSGYPESIINLINTI